MDIEPAREPAPQPRTDDARTGARTGSRWSWRIGSVFGVAIRVHVTLMLLLVWAVASYAIRGVQVGTAALGIALVASVFVIILVHELAHALMARHYGTVTRDILLLPIGGMSRMERLPEKPRQELAVALVGPAVNVVLAGVLALVLVATGGSFDPGDAATTPGAFLGQLLWINIILAGFNLLPAFPMDGGRALRALLAIRLGRARATQIALVVGRVLAAVFVLVGLMANLLLALIGVFVWFAGRAETSTMALQAAIAGVPVARAMIRELETVDIDAPVEQAADRMLAAGHLQLPVTDHGRIAGVVTAPELASAVASRGEHAPVRAALRRDVPTLAPEETLDSALALFERTGSDLALVVDHGVVIGVLTTAQLAGYAALHGQPAAA